MTLALSLHAPDDELRNELVPINTRFSVDETVDAAWNYARVTKRRVSIEYAMMRGINDQAWRADLLADVLLARGDWGWVHVNLIPLNPTPGSKWTASDPADEREFVRRLEARGIPTTVRDTRGREIDGACGQLGRDRDLTALRDASAGRRATAVARCQSALGEQVAASSTVSTRWMCVSIGRPRASAWSSGQAGSVSVQ